MLCWGKMVFQLQACIPCRVIGHVELEEKLLCFAVPGSWFLLMFFAGWEWFWFVASLVGFSRSTHTVYSYVCSQYANSLEQLVSERYLTDFFLRLQHSTSSAHISHSHTKWKITETLFALYCCCCHFGAFSTRGILDDESKARQQQRARSNEWIVIQISCFSFPSTVNCKSTHEHMNTNVVIKVKWELSFYLDGAKVFPFSS